MSLQFLPNLNFLKSTENKIKEDINKIYYSSLLYNTRTQTTMPLNYFNECTIGFATMDGTIVDNMDYTEEIPTTFHFTKIGLYKITIQCRNYDVNVPEQNVVATLDCADVDLLPQAYGTTLTSPIVLYYYNTKKRSGDASITLRLSDSSYSGTFNINLSKSNVVIEYLGTV